MCLSNPSFIGQVKDGGIASGGWLLTILTRALGLIDNVAGSFGLLDRPLDPDELIRVARRQTGLRDFGDTAFIGPLTRLLEACSTESALSLVGRSATRWDIIRFLSNLLTLQAATTAHPQIEAMPIRQPMFITGLPRSGTTFLHRLMLEDETNRGPTVWETISPSPSAGTKQQRIARVTRQLRTFGWLAPEFPGLHPMDATSPQECSEITAHVFRSLRFDTNYHIPSYRSWMDADVVRHLPAYRFHRRFLQYLQFQDGAPRRWVLKCPEHLFALEAIRAVYPDARLVFVHRDPAKVLLSQAQLTEVLRRPFTRKLDHMALGSHESRRWLDGTKRMIAVGDDAGLPEPVCHVHHLDLVTDPATTVEGVYRHFGLDFSAQAAGAVDAYVAAKPRGGYSLHDYRFEDHGLDEAQERAKFRPYMVRFGVTPEEAPRRREDQSPARVPEAGTRSLQS
jgi:hypothetical protein